MKKGDFLLIFFLLILVFAILFVNSIINTKTSKLIAQVIQRNEVIREIDLEKVVQAEKIQVLGKYETVILVENGRIRFEESDCPNQTCVNTGWLSKKGDIAVCLPNQTIIRILNSSNDMDEIIY